MSMVEFKDKNEQGLSAITNAASGAKTQGIFEREMSDLLGAQMSDIPGAPDPEMPDTFGMPGPDMQKNLEVDLEPSVSLDDYTM